MAMPVAYGPAGWASRRRRMDGRRRRRRRKRDTVAGGPSVRFATPLREPLPPVEPPPPSLGKDPSRAKRLPATRAPAPEETLGKKDLPPAFAKALAQVQARAQEALHWAMSYERARRWQEAIQYYQRMLRLLAKDNLPKDYLPSFSHTILMFETYYHVGVAFQKLDAHHYAVGEYSKAIDVIQVRKCYS